MKIGIMQPYFFPYIGYWQLINAVDEFLLFDVVQYIRHGWINRNRLLKQGGWTYVTLPLSAHSRDTKIKEITISDKIDLRVYVLNHFVIYKNKAPFYGETFELMDNVLSGVNSNNIVDINEYVIAKMMETLGIRAKLGVCSRMGFDYSNVKGPDDWPIEISRQRGASMYINPISGRNIYSYEKFDAANLKLSFIRPKDITYNQFYDRFEPSLSIIDVLMFNGVERTKQLLDEYDILDGASV